MEAWLPKISDNIALADLILYKIVRYMRKDNAIRNNWIDRCIDIAINSRNFSLIESLLLVLKREAWNYRKLIAIAKDPGGHPKSPTCGHLKIPHPPVDFSA